MTVFQSGPVPTSGRVPGSWQASERSLHVEASPEQVFALVADLGRSPEWAGSGEVRAMRRLDSGPIRVGSQWESDQQARGMRYHTVSAVEVYEPGRAFVWRVTPPTSGRSAWGFTLAPEGTGTRLTHFYDIDLATQFPLRLVTRLFFRLVNRGPEIGRHLEATLRNVKATAESHPGG